MNAVFPNHFYWKSRLLGLKVTKITSKKAQNRGTITSFYAKTSRKMTLPTFFIAFLCINFFQSWQNWIYFFRKLWTKNISTEKPKKNYILAKSLGVIFWERRIWVFLKKKCSFLAKLLEFFPNSWKNSGFLPNFWEILQNHGVLALSWLLTSSKNLSRGLCPKSRSSW